MQKCDRIDIRRGEVLLEPGKKNENIYIILSGRLHVRVGSVDAPVIAKMDVGSCVGEMSIIEDRDPSAYVIAAEPTHLLVIHKSILWKMIDASHKFAKNLLVLMSERVRSHNRFIAESIGNIQKIERHATTDALTGLSNRHAMEETFPREVERCIENQQPVSLIMCDVDNFKTFNDQFGHVAGDRALSAVGHVLRNHCSSRELIVRFGGDEFAILLPGTNENDAANIAEEIRCAVSGATEESEDSLLLVPVNLSMGVAQLKEHNSFDKLLRAADRALYRAKKKGRNTVST